MRRGCGSRPGVRCGATCSWPPACRSRSASSSRSRVEPHAMPPASGWRGRIAPDPFPAWTSLAAARPRSSASRVAAAIRRPRRSPGPGPAAWNAPCSKRSPGGLASPTTQRPRADVAARCPTPSHRAAPRLAPRQPAARCRWPRLMCRNRRPSRPWHRCGRSRCGPCSPVVGSSPNGRPWRRLLRRRGCIRPCCSIVPSLRS